MCCVVFVFLGFFFLLLFCSCFMDMCACVYTCVLDYMSVCILQSVKVRNFPLSFLSVCNAFFWNGGQRSHVLHKYPIRYSDIYCTALGHWTNLNKQLSLVREQLPHFD